MLIGVVKSFLGLPIRQEKKQKDFSAMYTKLLSTELLLKFVRNSILAWELESKIVCAF